MVHSMQFNTIHTVIESWEKLRRLENYAVKAGSLLFYRFFKACPEAKVMFGYPINMDVSTEGVMKSRKYLAHSETFIKMIDRALNMLGPDDELLTEVMTDLGVAHGKLGVGVQQYPAMKEGLFWALSELLKDDFDENTRGAWNIVFDALASDMIEASKPYL